MAKLSHFDEEGNAKMVDVGEKSMTQRMAVASGIIRMKPETMHLIQNQKLAKGDVIGVATVAGIMAAKQTSQLIPMCHPLPITSVKVDFQQLSQTQLEVKSIVKVTGQTGVEMEALFACSTAALTVYDMCKAVDKGMEITDIKLLEKSGGKSGHFVRE